MTHVELAKVEERYGGQLLFSVRFIGNDIRMELPVAIKDEGAIATNETSALRSALGLVEEMGASIKARLGVEHQIP